MQSLEALLLAEQCQTRLLSQAEKEIDRNTITQALTSIRSTLKLLADWSGRKPGIAHLR